MSDLILYEHPLNERIRVFLRLEHLFSQVSHFRSGKSIWDSEASIAALMEILAIVDRTDVRSELLKELDKYSHNFYRLQDAPGVDPDRLEKTLKELSEQLKTIQNLSSRLSSDIRENELLNSVRQRTAISGGTCGFDIPAYHYWLNQSRQTKAESLSRWLVDIHPFEDAIQLILSFLRSISFFKRQVAAIGFYQSALDTQNPCQLLRVSLPIECKAYPEVSGNKHRINIRFLTYAETGRPKQIGYNLEFNMSCCAL